MPPRTPCRPASDETSPRSRLAVAIFPARKRRRQAVPILPRDRLRTETESTCHNDVLYLYRRFSPAEFLPVANAGKTPVRPHEYNTGADECQHIRYYYFTYFEHEPRAFISHILIYDAI